MALRDTARCQNALLMHWQARLPHHLTRRHFYLLSSPARSLLCQELNTIKDFEIRGITAASNVTQTMVITTAAPGQQTMAAAPQMPGSATHGGRV